MNAWTEAARTFIRLYGDRGYYILKAILESTRSYIGRARLGDFDYKSVKSRLTQYGLSYNPSMLLSKLEREYGLIETTYKSGTQHWWKIVDVDAIEEAVAEYEGRPPKTRLSEDPRIRLLRIQFYAMDPERILSTLRTATRRKRVRREALVKIIFHDLPRIVEFLERAEEVYPDELAAEIEMAHLILKTAEEAVEALRASAGKRGSSHLQYSPFSSGEGEPL